MTSKIPNGQMFIQFPDKAIEPQATAKPRVWVKLDDDDDDYYADGSNPFSLFVTNEALTKFGFGAISHFNTKDKWLISDKYYDGCVKKGVFVPIDDLNEVEGICAERGYESCETGWDF